MMGAATGLHPTRHGGSCAKNFFNSGAPKLTPQHNRSRCINPVNLKHVLRQIQTIVLIFVMDGPLPGRINTTSLAH